MFRKTLIVFALIGALLSWRSKRPPRIPRSVHGGGWPIQGGVKHQPTRSAGGQFTRSQQEETDKLYDELMSNYGATHHTGDARTR